MSQFKFIESEKRPWGTFYVIHDEKNYKIKRIEVLPGKRLSYQFHNKRSECWTIIKGTALITIDNNDFRPNEGDSITINVKSKHRVENVGTTDLIFIEVQTGTYFGEDDIIRIEDDFKRV
jgi:mannose-6-phosphate isomerase